MSGPVKEILFVGFGAVGAIYSLILKRSGFARVTVVARSNYDSVKSEGVHFKSRKYGNIKGWKPDRLCKSVADAADTQYSYVVVATKAVPDLIQTPKILEPLLSPNYVAQFSQPTYVLLQNGLNVEVDLYNSLKALGRGEPSIISIAVWILTNFLAPNVVEHSDYARVALGVYRHKDFTTTVNSAQESALLADFGSVLELGGSIINIVPEIQRMKFIKNIWNVAFSSISTLTRYTPTAIFRSPPQDSASSYRPFVSPTTSNLISAYTIPAIEATLNELLVLGRALGFPDTEDGLPTSTVTNTLANTVSIYTKADSTHVPSMLLDAEKGQPIEVEVILGEVVRMAKERQVDMPHPARGDSVFSSPRCTESNSAQDRNWRTLEGSEHLEEDYLCDTFNSQSAYSSLSPCSPNKLYPPSRAFSNWRHPSMQLAVQQLGGRPLTLTTMNGVPRTMIS